MGHRLARLYIDDYQEPIIADILEHLIKKLDNCTNDECKVLYLRTLGNLKAPVMIPTLFTYAHTESYKVSTGALKALRSFSTAFWNTEKFRKNFEDIFYQTRKKYDSSARTIALDILLELNLTVKEFTRLVEYFTSNDKAFEIKQYLLQKLQVKSSTTEYYEQAMNLVFKIDKMLNNYHVLGQKGLSTAIMRSFSSYPSFNGSLLSVQEIKDGVLKRGNADVFVEADGQKFSIFTVSSHIFSLKNL